jgi:predicted DsbA family dithiol-disulfide isomerase
MMTSLRIDVVSDVVCPWCFVGAERLERVLTRLERDAEVVYHPFLLQPDTPPEGIDVPEMLRAKYGVEPRVMFERVEAAARQSGLELDLARQRYSYSTVRAHTLLRHALERGTQRALARRLFRANFVDAQNIDDVPTLAGLAREHGFSEEDASRLLDDAQELMQTRQEAAAAARSGVRGVPFFVFQGRAALSGAQPEEVFERVIEQATRGEL